jgi:hypothetical protein
MKSHHQAHAYSTVYYLKTLTVATLQIIDVSVDKQRKRKNRHTRRETCSSPTVFTINPTLNCLEYGAGLRNDRPVISRFSHGPIIRLKSWCSLCETKQGL